MHRLSLLFASASAVAPVSWRAAVLGVRQPMLQVLASVSSARTFHDTAATLGGRHTTALPERVRHWRQHISKKALKRYRKRREELRNRGGSSVPSSRGSQRAASTSLAQVQQPASLPSAEVLQQRTRESRVVLESMLALAPPVPSPAAALRTVDADAVVAALSPGGALPRVEANFSYGIRVLGAQGRFSDALALFAEMRAAGATPTVYTYVALLSACSEQRNATAALEVWDAMAEAGVAPSAVAYGALAHACVRARDLPAAFRVVAAAEADTAVSPHPLSSPVLWTTLIVGCVHVGDVERAWDVFHHMRRYHAAPDAVTYTALISACALRDRVEQALGLLDEMRQTGVEPTHATWNALIHCAGRSFRLASRAHDLFEEMESAGFAHDERSYNGVLLACAHSGDVRMARRYLHRMLGRGLRPGLTTINTLLAVYARALGGVHTSVATPTPRDVMLARAEGGELLGWDDPATAAARTQATRKDLGSYARLVDGADVDVLAENLLADYFSNDPNGRALESGDDEAVEDPQRRAVGMAESDEDALPVGDDITPDLPPLSEMAQDLSDPETMRALTELTRLGVVDADDATALVADNARYPAITVDDENVRAQVDARELASPCSATSPAAHWRRSSTTRPWVD